MVILWIGRETIRFFFLITDINRRIKWKKKKKNVTLERLFYRSFPCIATTMFVSLSPLPFFYSTLLYFILFFFFFICYLRSKVCTMYAIHARDKSKKRYERLNTFIPGRKKISPNRIKDVGACNFLENPWSAFYIQRGDRKAHCSAAQHVYNRESTTPIALLPALATHRANTFQFNFIEFLDSPRANDSPECASVNLFRS